MKPAAMAVNCAMQNLEKRPTGPLVSLNGFFAWLGLGLGLGLG